jgi:formylmethanofuran dehydrogenase subunit E
MKNIDFYNNVESIVLKDKLGEFLGVDEDFEYTFKDVVKLSGHSCPTVAGAYLMTLYSLKKLYPLGLPIRGEIKVELRDSKSAGTTGVLANVASFITGAKEEDGFKGLQGKYFRNNLLKFEVAMKGEMRFTRLDNQESVEVGYDLSNIVLSNFNPSLMQKGLQNIATKEEFETFGAAWQQRVKEILTIHKEKTLIFY